jgi:DNA-directed RNA polymerase subunit RPC12/RpoP
VAQKVITSRTQKARCKEQSKLVTEYNLRENSKLRDFKCDKCGTEFKQVTKGVYGGHRRSCRHYSGKPPLIRPFVLPSNEQTKRCGKCGTDKHLDEFNNQRTGRLGKANFCRLCARQHNRDKTAEAKSGTIKNETNALKDYTCPNCDKEFKQVKPGVFGGHRKNCINYSGRKEEFLKWSGSIQEFANLHELPFQTVWRWHLNRK